MKKTILIVCLGVFCLISSAYATSVWVDTKIVSADTEKISYIAGTVRKNQGGTWFVQNDANHKDMGIDSVLVNGNRIRINYDFTAQKVVSLIITPDDALAKKGYVVSGSGVGLNSAEFGVGRMLNLYGGVSYDATRSEWIVSYQNSNEYTISVEQRANGVLRIWHEQDDFGVIPVQLTPRDGGYTPKLYLFGPKYFDIRFYDDDGNLVTTFDQQCNFLFNRSGYRMVDVATEVFPADGNFWVQGIMEVQ